MANQNVTWCPRVMTSLCSPYPSMLTPLHLASEKSHNDVIELLVKHEAKVSRNAW